jgi:hypothetical protein
MYSLYVSIVMLSISVFSNMPNIIKFSDVMLSVLTHSVKILNVQMLRAIMLNVIMLSVDQRHPIKLDCLMAYL